MNSFSLTFGWEHLNLHRCLGPVDLKDFLEFFISQVGRCIEVVQHTAGWLDAVLLCCLWCCEAVIATAHEVHKGWTTVTQLMWVVHILQEGLLGEPIG